MYWLEVLFYISIHPPRAGRDVPPAELYSCPVTFQSTRPVRGGTARIDSTRSTIEISIHPPRAGRDESGPGWTTTGFHFNPPAPCGAGPPPISRMPIVSSNFNPPAPCGAGPTITRAIPSIKDFNPPAPCGAGRKSYSYRIFIPPFQSTRPVRGGTIVFFFP